MASVESLFENIYHKKTKKYFEEVLDSYTAGNYRSSVVMLYSVVVCDLVYKLKELHEMYEDAIAEDILSEIHDEQKKNSTSPEWEQKLIDLVFQKTNLLDSIVNENIRHLKQHRHLSAHPVLDELDILFMPTKENARAHIRNMLEGLLIKSPIFSKDIFDFFMEDIADNQKNFPANETDKLDKYLETKYFIHFNKALEEKVFKALWKFVFRKEDEDGEQFKVNREINFRVLELMYKRNRIELASLIKENASYYSQISGSDATIKKLIRFLTKYEDVFNLLEDHSKQLLTDNIHLQNEFIIESHFLSDSPVEHFSLLSEKFHKENNGYVPFKLKHVFTVDEIEILEWIATEHDCMEEFLTLMVTHYAYSGSFYEADTTFSICIAPFLEKFNKQHFVSLLEGINKNNQIFNRNAARGDNTKIKEYIDDKFGDDIDYQMYNNFEYNDEENQE